MDVIKQILFLVFLIPFLCFGQKTPYPKDTIYILFDKKSKNKKWLGYYGYGKNRKEGILFNLKDVNNLSMSFFVEKKVKPDTLPLRYLKNYTFIDNVKNIRKKEIDWVERRYAKSKYKPYSGSKNAVFQTYIIEVISKKEFVIYPVIWRNEGVID